MPDSDVATRAMVVEDELVIALDLKLSLIRLGYHDTVALASGEHALSLAALFPPALVLMDLRIAGAFDGVETAHRMRSHGDFALVYVTGGMDAAARAMAERYPPDAWLLKPFEPAQIEAAVARAFGTRRLRPP